MGPLGPPMGPQGPPFHFNFFVEKSKKSNVDVNAKSKNLGSPKKKSIKKSMEFVLLVKNGYKGIFLTVFLALGAHGDPWGPGPGPRKL